jgi:alkylhydroperoxidase family enzyme
MKALDLTLYSKENAPELSRDLLDAIELKFGFIPNILRQMAEAPAALGGTLQLMGILEKSSLSPAEQWIALLVEAFQNTSAYCVAANSTVAQMMGVPGDIIDGIRQGQPLADPRLEASRSFTAEMVHERGLVSKETTLQFINAGFTKAQVLEVILEIALETMASYTDRVLGTPMDEQYQANTWTRPVATGAA